MSKKLMFLGIFEKAVGIGGTATVLYLLILIFKYGEVTVYEKVPLILFTEIFLLTIGLGLMIKGVLKSEY